MNLTFDRNLFTQMGLDSGSLTMLDAVIHSFHEPGEYRGTARNEKGATLAVFYISVMKDSPVAQANIDLALLVDGHGLNDQHNKCETPQNHFTVNPKGYAVFHVSRGNGGYNVHVRKADQETKEDFDSRNLNTGDIFSGVIIRPGRYQVNSNDHKNKAEIIVPYPKIGEKAYRPPGPLRVEVSDNGFSPDKIELQPGQGFSFDCRTLSRIKIELLEPYDKR